MALIRVYIDTSVVGGCFDEEFSEESRALFELAKSGRLRLLISNLLADELTMAPDHVQKVVSDLRPASLEIVHESDQSRRLRDLYLREGVVGRTHVNDAHHVAVATVTKADMVVSWNFKHIVHYDKIRGFNKVNSEAGYPPIQILCPLEVI